MDWLLLMMMRRKRGTEGGGMPVPFQRPVVLGALHGCPVSHVQIKAVVTERFKMMGGIDKGGDVRRIVDRPMPAKGIQLVTPWVD
jgi:hypothetical protein